MKSLAICCRLCGNDNLFPVKYAGRTLSCSHCGEPLPIADADGTPVVAVASPATTDSPPRETGLRRLTKAVSFGLALACLLILGAIGGGWAGLMLAVKFGFLATLVSWFTCPAGGVCGLWLSRWLGQGVARLVSSYRLAFPGLVLGMAGGFLYWSQTTETAPTRLTAAQIGWSEGIGLAMAIALGGLLLALIAMFLDAVTNFTR